MEDIAPALLEEIRKRFTAAMAADQRLAGIYQTIQQGAATYAAAGEYAGLVGQLLSGAIESVLTPDALPDGQLYYNIAEKIFRPVLEENHEISSQAAAMVQKALNEKAGIGLQAQTVPVNQDRIDGIIEYACASDPAEMNLSPVIDNFSRNVVDETLKANADFHSNVGFSPVITRRMVGGGCKWCRSLAGTYDYPDKTPKDVFRRHENCRCTIEYDPGTGKVQNVHTKKWTGAEGNARIEERKSFDNTAAKKEEIRKAANLTKAGQIAIPAKRINTDSLSFDAEHVERHGVTKEQAISWIESAKCSMDVWNGDFTRFIAEDGATYVDNQQNKIRTAFPREQFTKNFEKVLEILEND